MCKALANPLSELISNRPPGTPSFISRGMTIFPARQQAFENSRCPAKNSVPSASGRSTDFHGASLDRLA
eukprot:952784-Pyramimonas_sp.AAC.1